MSPRNELGALFVRAAVRGLGGVAAMATLPLLTRAMNASSGRIVTGAKQAVVVARDHACAVKHGIPRVPERAAHAGEKPSPQDQNATPVMTTKGPTTIKTGEVVTISLLASEITDLIGALLGEAAIRSANALCEEDHAHRETAARPRRAAGRRPLTPHPPERRLSHVRSQQAGGPLLERGRRPAAPAPAGQDRRRKHPRRA